MCGPSASSGETVGAKPGSAEVPGISGTNSNSNDSVETVQTHPASWSQSVSAELRARFIDGFSPAYFASVMGTGMSANLLYNFPYPARWLQVCGIIMALVGLVLFVGLCGFFAVALYCRPRLFSQIHRDPVVAPAMGCFVMGYTTLFTFLHNVLGASWIVGVWVLWWVVVFGSFYTGIVTFYFSSMAKHRNSKNRLEPTSLGMHYLLPVVTLTVAASMGGIITADLPTTNDKIVTMTVSLMMWAIAMLLASIIVTINFWRMLVHKIPHSGQVLAMFLPIGFVGQGAFAILYFGQNCTSLLLEHHDTVAASSYVSFLSGTAQNNGVALTHLPLLMSTAIMVTCSIVAFMSIAFGFLLTVFAYMSLVSKMSPFAIKRNHAFLYQPTSRSPIKRFFAGLLKFQRGFWSMTFPLGTMSLAINHFYSLYNGFVAFRVVATIYAMLVLITTLGCLVGVVYKGLMIFIRARATAESKNDEQV